MKKRIEKNNLKSLLEKQNYFYKINKVLAYPFIFSIKIYRKLISPAFVSCCRFTPTCSEYSLEALKKYGLIKGLYLSIKRILKCNQFFQGGEDLVP